jgi:hypothetical protein
MEYLDFLYIIVTLFLDVANLLISDNPNETKSILRAQTMDHLLCIYFLDLLSQINENFC